MLVVALVLVVFAASAAATAVIATRGFGGTGSTTGVEAAIVDIDTTLGGGDAAAGTGMVLTSSGEVLTNNHVINGALTISVELTFRSCSGFNAIYIPAVLVAPYPPVKPITVPTPGSLLIIFTKRSVRVLMDW